MIKKLLKSSGYKVYYHCDFAENTKSGTGIRRYYNFYIVYKKEIVNINKKINEIIGYKLSKRGSIISASYGGDPGYLIVCLLSLNLYKDSYKLKAIQI